MKKIMESYFIQKIEKVEYEYDSQEEFNEHHKQMLNDGYEIELCQSLWAEYVRYTKIK